MLILSRKKDEKIVIGDNIEVTIVDVKGDMVKIGISAPGDVKIYRAELLDLIKKANIEASAPAETDLEALARKIRKK